MDLQRDIPVEEAADRPVTSGTAEEPADRIIECSAESCIFHAGGTECSLEARGVGVSIGPDENGAVKCKAFEPMGAEDEAAPPAETPAEELPAYEPLSLPQPRRAQPPRRGVPPPPSF